MLAGLADFIERLPGFFGKLSLPLSALGAALEIALRYGIIKPDAWDGRIADTAPVLWVAGLALAAVWCMQELVKLPGLLRLRSARNQHRRQVRGNLQFLDNDALLLLYFVAKYQGGRIPGLDGAQAFKNLRSFGMVELERDFIDTGWDSTGTYRLNPAIGSPAEIVEKIGPPLAKHFGIDPNNPDAVAATLKRRLNPSPFE